MKIYTKTGDDGTTGLFGGGRVRKDTARISAVGEVDELNAALGMARALCREEGQNGARGRAMPAAAVGDLDALLARIQSDLFDIGADIATPEGVKAASHVRRTGKEDARYLEEAIDRIDKELEPLERFILPGGTPLAAQLHLARAVCRRAERSVVALAGSEKIGEGVLVFLNRLSDLLFVMGRAANRRANEAETHWTPRGPGRK